MTVNKIETVDEFWKLQNEGKEIHMYSLRDGEQDFSWKDLQVVVKPINTAKFYQDKMSFTDKIEFIKYLDDAESAYRKEKEEFEEEISDDDEFLSYINDGRQTAARMHGDMTVVDFDGYFDIFDSWNVVMHDDVMTYQLGYID